MSSNPYLVVDASIVGTACAHSDLGDAFKKALFTIEERYVLVLDDNDFIVNEYDRHMHRNDVVQRWWLRIIARQGARYKVHGALSKQDRKDLQDAKFDSDDFTYVAVAKKANAPIVHEDSDYCKAESVILNRCGVRCMHIGAL